MHPLNLPDFEYKVKKEAGKLWIYDQIRKKFIVLTPEEWVRQHFVNFLIHHRNYPKSLIKIEGGLVYNQLKKRSDIVVFDRNGRPWLVIECKAFSVAIDDRTVWQAAMYNQSLRSPFLAITNGLKHYVAKVDWELASTQPLDTLPDFEQ